MWCLILFCFGNHFHAWKFWKQIINGFLIQIKFFTPLLPLINTLYQHCLFQFIFSFWFLRFLPFLLIWNLECHVHVVREVKSISHTKDFRKFDFFLSISHEGCFTDLFLSNICWKIYIVEWCRFMICWFSHCIKTKLINFLGHNIK